MSAIQKAVISVGKDSRSIPTSAARSIVYPSMTSWNISIWLVKSTELPTWKRWLKSAEELILVK
jgi:hypothetical protein